MHLAYVPWHVRRRKRDVQPFCHALFVHRIHVLNPHGHPSAFVGDLVSARAEGRRICSSPAASLASLTKKNLACSGAHRSEGRWRSPVPALAPAPFLEPSEAARDVRDIQDRCYAFRVHGRKSIARGEATGEKRSKTVGYPSQTAQRRLYARASSRFLFGAEEGVAQNEQNGEHPDERAHFAVFTTADFYKSKRQNAEAQPGGDAERQRRGD